MAGQCDILFEQNFAYSVCLDDIIDLLNAEEYLYVLK